jgi:hypothetical protein
MLDPMRHVATNPCASGEGTSKNMSLKCMLIQLMVHNKDKHMAKSISFKNACFYVPLILCMTVLIRHKKIAHQGLNVSIKLKILLYKIFKVI